MGIPYLNYFFITNKPVDNAVNANLTLFELHNLIAEQQKVSRDTSSASYGIAIEVFDKETNTTTSYISACEAGKALSDSKSTILRNIRGENKKPFRNRYILTEKKVGF
jgi:hypothetical protein